MRLVQRIISVLLLSVIALTSLCSCGLPDAIIDFLSESPDSKEDLKYFDDNQGAQNKDPSDNEENNSQTTNSGQTTEPDNTLSPEEEANMARYGYMPVVSNTMAVIYINTPYGSNEWVTKYSKNDKVAGNIDYVSATVSTSGCESEQVITNAEAKVKVRGNATLDYEKKPIRIKFENKTNLLGLHDGEKYKNWVLLADYKDLSLSNNTAAFFLGNLILGSDGYYCTDFRNVEVYLNGEYWGVYLLVEQQEVKDNRASVPEVEEDYTGTDIGYFFEYDGYYTEEGTSYLDNGEGDPTFTIDHLGLQGRTNGYTVKSDLYSKDQLNFLKNYLGKVFYIAKEASKGNYYKFDANYNVVKDDSAISSKSVIASIIDVQSLVDIYILNEIACDLDVDWSSFYLSLDMTADGNKKVTFEAPWDWDSCFGLRFDVDAAVPNAQGMYAYKKNPWFKLVSGQEWFWDMVYEKWSEMKKYDVLDRTINLIRDQKAIYAEYYIKNNQRWPGRVTKGNNEVNSVLNSYRDINTAQSLAADYLINWLNLRFQYLDSQWCLDGDSAYGENKDQTINRPLNSTAYRFEAEDALLTHFVTDSPVRSNRYFASAGAYVSDMYKGSTLTFELYVTKTTTVYIYVCVAKRAQSYDFSECFTVSVNGKKISIPAREIPAVEVGEEEWHSFACIRVSTALVGAGTNTVTVTAVTDTTNIDYIEIYSSESIK